jgi:catechol 2,3-dioxygenase-like lactoylglutathione lyase family enzyme
MPTKGANKSDRSKEHPAAQPKGPQFASVAIVVSDSEQALDWYTSKLGLEVTDHDGHWVTVGLKGQSGKLHLCQPSEGNPQDQLEPGNSGILLTVAGSDFGAACAEMKERGVEFSTEPTTEPWGTYAVIRDPDGNEHMLMPES